MADHSDSGLLLSTSPPSPTQVRLAATVVAALLAGLATAAPVATHPLDGTEILLPVYAALVTVNDLITAALLLSLFAIERSRGILALASGYLFSALLVAPWALTFPGVFDPAGLLADQYQATAWIAAARRVGFPLFVLVYALARDRRPAFAASPGPAVRAVAGVVAGVAAGAAAVAAVAILAEPWLPRLMLDARHIAPAWRFVPLVAMTLYALCLVALVRRGRAALDLWVGVVVISLAIELLLLSYLSSGGRFSLGWWAGRFYGLVSASVILIVLLAETTSLSARLARLTVSEARARAARITALEALSATIAHEVNQPLASMVTNAGAGLRWLDRPEPDLGEARHALARIAADGHRAGELVAGIRAMFKGEPVAARAPVDLAALVAETLRCLERDARLGHVAVETDLAPGLPPVYANAVQLRQVIANLAANAIDAMAPVTGRARVLRVSARTAAPGEAVVTVADTGIGFGDAGPERFFAPFVTTKSEGLGMGLMFCRAVIEAHGGRIWAEANRPEGAVFAFALPLATGAPR